MKYCDTDIHSLLTLPLAILLFCLICFPTNSHGAPLNTIVVLEVDGAIGPASSDYMQRGIRMAVEQHAAMVIIQLDTPGGLDKSMRDIIKAILASPVPVVTYVAPSGARAASAGTFLLYASPIAVMAPGTNIGAASPVSIGGETPEPTPQPESDADDADTDKDAKPAEQSTLSKKITNDAVAYIRSLAQLRGRNVEFAEAAVQDAATLTAEEALQHNVIDLIATDLDDLIQKLDGYTVELLGETHTLATDPHQTVHFIPDWRTKLLAVITDPTVAYILLLIGIYGLFFEFANPGFIVPGVVGAIALILALYALQTLPISYAGLGLLLLGVVFMVGEVFMPSFGALGLGGIIAFVAGSILLLDSDLPGYAIAWQAIAAMAIISGAFFFIVLSIAIRARRKTVVSGNQPLIGATGYAMEAITGQGLAKIHGELWTVKTDTPVHKGDSVRVIKASGTILIVQPETVRDEPKN